MILELLNSGTVILHFMSIKGENWHIINDYVYLDTSVSIAQNSLMDRKNTSCNPKCYGPYRCC